MAPRAPEPAWRRACTRRDLVADSGVVALVDDVQVALFYLPGAGEALYAVDNRDPQSGANVIGRGIVGHVGGELVVASPLYKQHFRLRDGRCVEDAGQRLRTWRARFNGDAVELAWPPGPAMAPTTAAALVPAPATAAGRPESKPAFPSLTY